MAKFGTAAEDVVGDKGDPSMIVGVTGCHCHSASKQRKMGYI